MSVSLLPQSKFGSVAASTTLFWPCGITIGGNALQHTTEANINVPYRSAGKITKLLINVSTNDRGASTFTLRKNSSNGNNSVSIGGSSTGQFSDSSNSDSIAIGDKVCTSIITGSGGTTFTNTALSAQFTPDINSITLSKYIWNNVNETTNFSVASTNNFLGVADSLNNTTETTTKFPVKTNGSIKFLSSFVITNTRATATTIGNRKNGSNGNLSISVGSAATGLFEDTTNSDSLVSGDLINSYVSTGTGAGNFIAGFVSQSFITANDNWQTVSIGAHTQTQGVTSYYNITDTSNDTSDANVEVKSNVPFFVTNFFYQNSTNTVTATSTINFRVNGANSVLALSVPASTTGSFQDNSTVLKLVGTEQINYQTVMGSGGTSSQVIQFGSVFRNIPDGGTFFGCGI